MLQYIHRNPPSEHPMNSKNPSAPDCSWLTEASFRPWLGLSNGHVQTVLGAKWPRSSVHYERERLELDDGDFLDLDWSRVGGKDLAVLSHGLEGHSQRPYITGMVRRLNRDGWDCLAWNYRGCGGEINRNPCLYHNGSTADLDAVIAHAMRAGYSRIMLAGFSLGGNLTLLYLGRERAREGVVAAVVFSVPCDLASASIAIGQPQNVFYMRRFLRELHKKVQAKARQYPHLVSDTGYASIRDFKGFDDRYTAPLHGFSSAEDYWEKCSSLPWLGQIRVPTLIINAADDPFLGKGCFPVDACAANPNLTLLIPERGGHCGFVDELDNRWSERMASAFFRGCVMR